MRASMALALGAAALAAAQTFPSTTVAPCAAVGSLVSKGTRNIPADVAFNCLDSVPVDVPGNSELIDELKLLWQWHSETGWLKNPPPTWENGPLDLIAELDNIKSELSQFSSEYAVQLAIWALTVRTGNGHLSYQPDILQVFGWLRQVGVVSLSDDGKALPKFYLSNDTSARNTSSSVSISPITTINKVEVNAYLADLADFGQYIDGDSKLNSVLYRGESASMLGSFLAQTVYDGPSTNFAFANGSSKSYPNFARTSLNFTGVVDGKSFFKAFCTGAISAYQGPDASTKMDLAAAKATGSDEPLGREISKRQVIPSDYATAVVRHSDGLVGGYFMTTPGYTDVAVLKIASFSAATSVDDKNGFEFQKVVTQFLSNCIQAKKTKLIVDLRGNGGGDTSLLFDTFIQLFPSVTPFSAQRNRAIDAFKLVGDSVNEIYNNPTLLQKAIKFLDGNSTDDFSQAFRMWAYWLEVDVNYVNFASWLQFYGPYRYNNDLFQTNFRYNYSLPIAYSGQNVFRLSNVANKPQPFDTKNVLMFTDGLCASSCASFHEELKNIMGVKSVVIGGRPRNAPMQVIGGTKGGEVAVLNSFPQTAAQLLNMTKAIGAPSLKTLNNSVVVDTASVSEVLVRAGDSSTRLQIQDQIRKGDTTGTPLQYVYEAADCRIFYTAKTLYSPQDAWVAAWDAFGNSACCAAGSTGDKSSISGGYKPFGPGPLNGNMGQGNNTAKPSTGPPTSKPGSTSAATKPTSVPASGATSPTRPYVSTSQAIASMAKPSNSTTPVTAKPSTASATTVPGASPLASSSRPASSSSAGTVNSRPSNSTSPLSRPSTAPATTAPVGSLTSAKPPVSAPAATSPLRPSNATSTTPMARPSGPVAGGNATSSKPSGALFTGGAAASSYAASLGSLGAIGALVLGVVGAMA